MYISELKLKNSRSFKGTVRKRRIYNDKEVSSIKKVDFRSQGIDFFILLH
jgi:hypothetical protein